MRVLYYVFLLLLAICLVIVAMANRQIVTLNLLPEEMATYSGISLAADLPLYAVGFGGLLAGLLIGFFWEWVRESKHRTVASRQRREVAKLQRELDRHKAEKDRSEGRDEVLALLDKGTKAR